MRRGLAGGLAGGSAGLFPEAAGPRDAEDAAPVRYRFPRIALKHEEIGEPARLDGPSSS